MDNDGRRRTIRNLKKNRIIYGRMVQRWFLLHLSVGCHIFFSILLIIIVKCLFILAAVSPHILASLAVKGRRRIGSISVGIKTGFFTCTEMLTQGIFLCGKTLWFRCYDQAARQFFFLVTCLWILRCEGIYKLCPFVSSTNGMAWISVIGPRAYFSKIQKKVPNNASETSNCIIFEVIKRRTQCNVCSLCVTIIGKRRNFELLLLSDEDCQWRKKGEKRKR